MNIKVAAFTVSEKSSNSLAYQLSHGERCVRGWKLPYIKYYVNTYIPLYNGFYLFPLSRAVNSNRLIFDPSEVKIDQYMFIWIFVENKVDFVDFIMSQQTRPRGYPAHLCLNANICWHLNIYYHD